MRSFICFVAALIPCLCPATEPTANEGLLSPLPVGFSQLRVITPDLLELTREGERSGWHVKTTQEDKIEHGK